MDIRGLQALGLLVTDPEGGVAVVNGRGWYQVPAPLSEVVIKALAPQEG